MTVKELVKAGQEGVMLAPGRHDRGTNAIALGQPDGFVFAFGEGSLERHRRQCTATTIICRAGLALDIDVVEDIAMLVGAPAERPGGSNLRPR